MSYTEDQVRKALIHKIWQLVKTCDRCAFGANGRALPFFGKNAKYLIVGEAPHVEEIAQGFPFVGTSGENMWKAFKDIVGLVRDEFIIFNSVMCKPTVPDGKTIGKPTKKHIEGCFIMRTDVLSMLYDHFNVRHILVLGNYAKYIFSGQMSGIDSESGNSYPFKSNDREFTLTYCLHPAAMSYNPSNRSKFEQSLKAFGEAINFG